MVDAFAIVVALFRLPVMSQRAGVVADAFVVTVTTVAIVPIADVVFAAAVIFAVSEAIVLAVTICVVTISYT